jgi:hypothetical protein
MIFFLYKTLPNFVIEVIWMNSYDAGLLVFEFSALGESKFCFFVFFSWLSSNGQDEFIGSQYILQSCSLVP